MGAPSGGSPKPGPLGPDSLLPDSAKRTFHILVLEGHYRWDSPPLFPVDRSPHAWTVSLTSSRVIVLKSVLDCRQSDMRSDRCPTILAADNCRHIRGG